MDELVSLQARTIGAIEGILEMKDLKLIPSDVLIDKIEAILKQFDESHRQIVYYKQS